MKLHLIDSILLNNFESRYSYIYWFVQRVDQKREFSLDCNLPLSQEESHYKGIAVTYSALVSQLSALSSMIEVFPSQFLVKFTFTSPSSGTAYGKCRRIVSGLKFLSKI